MTWKLVNRIMRYGAFILSYSRPLTYSIYGVRYNSIRFKWHITLFAHAYLVVACIKIFSMRWGAMFVCPFAGLLTLGIEIEIYLFARPLFDAIRCACEANWNVLLKLFQNPHKGLASMWFSPFLWSAIFSRSILVFSHSACESSSLHALMYMHRNEKKKHLYNITKLRFCSSKTFSSTRVFPQFTVLLYFFLLILVSLFVNIFRVHCDQATPSHARQAICALHKY